MPKLSPKLKKLLTEKVKPGYEKATEGMTDKERADRARKKIEETDTKEKMMETVSRKAEEFTGSPAVGAAAGTGVDLIDKLTPKTLGDIPLAMIGGPGAKALKSAAKSSSAIKYGDEAAEALTDSQKVRAQKDMALKLGQKSVPQETQKKLVDQYLKDNPYIKIDPADLTRDTYQKLYLELRKKKLIPGPK